ncbi:MAG: toll/interleukin-1 receptor domain-containing protein [Methanosarcinaceae archaeon]|nr:toll/interleukin-1 receptor domain-containing protein [Methanosarcinaceae archaeon]
MQNGYPLLLYNKKIKAIQLMENPTCFISYSWDNDEHKDWVRALATKLQNKGIETKLDQWDCHLGTDLTKYMETCVRESDFVLLICTPEFCQKANTGQGGVGYEKNIVTGEIFEGISSSKKFVPILRKGRLMDSLPSYLKSKMFIDFTIDKMFDSKIEELIRHLHHSPKYERPPLGQKPYFSSNKQIVINEEFDRPVVESVNRNLVMGEEAPQVILDMFFRRHGARIERFPLSLVNPETLHSLEINGVLKNEGGGVVQYAVITLYIHSKILSPQSLQKNTKLRQLKIQFEDGEEDVYVLDINWGGEKMPLFKSVEYRLFEEDLGINFKQPWLEGNKSSFIMWKVRAPRMEPTEGFFRFMIEDNFAVLKQEVVPNILAITQDGKNRDFLKSPDNSCDPNL